jgi:hypothetical protein
MTADDRTSEDLRSTIDAIDADATSLAEIERQKRELEPDDPRMVALSNHAVELAQRAERAAVSERQLVEEAAEDEPPRRPN